MLNTFDGVSYKRVAGKTGDRAPALGFERERILFTASGGETSINLTAVSGSFLYYPGHSQIEVKRSGGGALISGVDFFETAPDSISFPDSEPLQVGEIVEITKNLSITGVMALASRADAYTATAFGGQTTITADFSWDYNLNPGKGIGAVQVFINGLSKTRGVDFDEVDVGLARTNSIAMLSPLAEGDQIQILPVYQAIDDSAAATSFNTQTIVRTQEALKSLGRSFVDESEAVSVPGTQIINRAKIIDPTRNLRAHFGIERIATKAVFEIQKESDPNSKRIYGIAGDDRELIRCVGTWENINSTDGTFIVAKTVDSYIEVTFYGTGLNILLFLESLQTGADFRASVDGGSEGLNIVPALSPVLDNRFANGNIVIPAARGLSLGLHTVKIRRANSTSAELPVFGVDIVNDSPLIQVSEGSAIISGTKIRSNAQSVAHNASSIGTRGGRATIYITKEGVVGQAFQATDSVERLWSAASHASEELIRSYHWREFGAGRADDFSGIAGSVAGTYAFTLEDGTTTLTAVNPTVSNNGIYVALGQSMAITFVGTGLDVHLAAEAAPSTVALSVTVDGVACTTNATGLSPSTIYRVCSGLPYGVHTARFTYGSSGSSFPALLKFDVYGPRRAELPKDCVELADFFILGNVTPKSSAGIDSAASGAISKMAVREFVYANGPWSATLNSSYRGGWYVQSNTQGAYLEHSFFGTGFDFRSVRSTDQSSNITVQLTNAAGTLVPLNSSYSNAAEVRVGTYGGLTFGGILNSESPLSTAASNVLNCNGAVTLGTGFYVKGLPLGFYTVRFTQSAPQAANSYLTTSGIDIFTPTHVPQSSPLNIQNALSVGSCSISDTRTLSPFEGLRERKKAWALAIGQGASPSTALSNVPTPGLSTTLYTPRCVLSISTSICAYHNQTVRGVIYAIFVDGIQASETFMFDVWGANSGTNTGSLSVNVPVSEGFHRIEVMHRTGSGTLTLSTRSLSVQEL